MIRAADRDFLRDDQYRDATHLNARIALHARFGTNPYGWHRWVFDQLALPPDAHVLEVGCGPAMLWRENVDRLPPDWQVTLSDFSPGMLAAARSHLSTVGRPFTFEVADAQALPFADASFDAVVANHMLYHVPDKPQAVAEFRRVLKPGGRFYAGTNGADHMRELFALGHRFAIPGYAALSPALLSFRLENGRDLIAQEFARVTVRRYPEGLRVTDASAVVAYLRSGTDASPETEVKLKEVGRFVEQEIVRQGALGITKSSGMFVAVGTKRSKPPTLRPPV